MAKTTTKTSKSPAKKAAKPNSTESLVKLAESVLQKLETLGIEQKLQAEIQWCIGSYKHDKNPVGIFEKMAEALPILKAELAKKTKGITAKLIGDVEKIFAL